LAPLVTHERWDSQGKETEQNWLEREKGINHVRGMLNGGVHKQYVNTFMAVMKAWFIVDSSRVVSVERRMCVLKITLSDRRTP
jgi:hypothetical protein